MAGPGRPGGFPHAFERLNLTPDQRARIREIFRKYRPRTDSVLRESMPRLRALTDSARAEMRDVLTPEQRARLDSMWGAFRPLRGRAGRFPGPEPEGRFGPGPGTLPGPDGPPPR
jgi:Spy/CpxP family protein refolding chaperone